MTTPGLVARAYVYSGEWTADCPLPCGNAELLCCAPGEGGPRTGRKPAFHCSYCRTMAGIEWPPDDEAAAIMDVLWKRPIPYTRNWYPEGHPIGNNGVPTGQTVDDLIAESLEHGVE